MLEMERVNRLVSVGYPVVIIIVVAWLLAFIARKWLLRVITKMVKRMKTSWGCVLLEEHFFQYLFYLMPPLFMDIAFKVIYGNWNKIESIHHILVVWILIVSGLMLVALLDIVNKIYESYPVAKNRPIKVFIQVAKIFVMSVIFIIIVSVLIGESPRDLLVGLGAFAAVLMLIFKDAILGFVAGIQLLANEMVRIGDWIVMPAHNADGTVLEINLYTVKVQNWDMTITTIPTYQMVSQSFTNWRGMEESEGRRIMRSIAIDMHSVHFWSEENTERLKEVAFLKEYIEQENTLLCTRKGMNESILNEPYLTNLGVFRHYVVWYLQANPIINLDMTYMVRQLQPTATGIPLQIYCFSKNQDWVAYEYIQADLFDHLLSVIPYFDLEIFQYPNRFLLHDFAEKKS